MVQKDSGDKDALRVLVLGAAGQIGREFINLLPEETTILKPREAVDVTDEKMLDTVVATLKPDVVVNAAAITNPRIASEDRRYTWRTNAIGAGRVAKLCATYGLTLIHLSTYEVFGGDLLETPYEELDVATPVSLIGHTKLSAEHAILEVGHCVLPEDISRGYRWFILRLGEVYGRPNTANRNFVQDFFSRATRSRVPPRVARDVVRSPVYAPHLAHLVAWLSQNHHEVPCGVYHIADKPATHVQIASEMRVCTRMGLENFEVVDRDAYAIDLGVEPFMVPRNGALSPKLWLDAGGIKLPPWQTGIAQFVREAVKT